MLKLPKVKSHWPKQVKLKTIGLLNITQGGKITGIKTVNAGTTLDVVTVNTMHVLVALDGSASPLPIEHCDLVDRMGGEAAILALPDDDAVAATSEVLVERPNSSTGQSLEKPKAPGPVVSSLAIPKNPNADLLAKLMRIPRSWPKQVTVAKHTDVPIFESGKIVGSSTVQPGATLRLVVIEPQGLVLSVGGTPALVPVENTNIVELMGGMAAVMATPNEL